MTSLISVALVALAVAFLAINSREADNSNIGRLARERRLFFEESEKGQVYDQQVAPLSYVDTTFYQYSDTILGTICIFSYSSTSSSGLGSVYDPNRAGTGSCPNDCGENTEWWTFQGDYLVLDCTGGCYYVPEDTEEADDDDGGD